MLSLLHLGLESPKKILLKVNPVKELSGYLTVDADGGFKPPSALNEITAD